MGVGMGFCGPLMDLLGLPTIGVCLIGKSSTGKSLSLELAVSPWSQPDPKKGSGLAKTFRSTANAVDAVASRGNGTILAYDELNLAPKKDLEQIIYTVSAGVGKDAMDVNRDLRDNPFAWSTFVVITGEKTPAEYLAKESGKILGGGAETRQWNVGVVGFNEAVSHEFIKSFREEGFRKNFGHAGKLFVQSLFDGGYVSDPNSLRKEHGEIAHDLAKGVSGKLGRTAEIPATICLAARLVGRLGILPVEAAQRIEDATRRLWGLYLEGPVANGNEAVKDRINQWITERFGTTICGCDDPTTARGLVREGWYDDRHFYLTDENLVRAEGGTLGPKEIHNILNGLSLVGPGRSREHKKRYVPKNSGVQAYPLVRATADKTGFGDPSYGGVEGAGISAISRPHAPGEAF